MRWLPFLALVVGGIVLMLRDEGETIAGLEPSSFAMMLVSATLLLFIGASTLAGYRGRIGQVLKDLAVWGAIALALVAGYTYRSEFGEIAHRITGELMPPGDVQVIEQRPGGERSVRIRRRGDGHFVARTQLNGASVNMLVDTGASTVVLRAVDARQMGLDVDRLNYTVPVQTANGTAYAAAVRLRQINIGPIVLTGVEALVAKPGALKESLLGMSFLRRLRSYEFTGDFLTLRS